MKVAFDVKGTLEGPKGELVRKLLDGFIAKGNVQISIWSNAYSYATSYILNNPELDGKVTPELKFAKTDVLEGYEQKIVGYEKAADGTEDKSKPIMANDRSKPIYSNYVKDLAIEDDPYQMYLGAKRIILVEELTEELVAELLG